MPYGIFCLSNYQNSFLAQCYLLLDTVSPFSRNNCHRLKKSLSLLQLIQATDRKKLNKNKTLRSVDVHSVTILIFILYKLASWHLVIWVFWETKRGSKKYVFDLYVVCCIFSSLNIKWKISLRHYLTLSRFASLSNLYAVFHLYLGSTTVLCISIQN